MSSRTPRLEEVLRLAYRTMQTDLHVALPGRVEKYDASTQKADVKPLLQRHLSIPEQGELIEPLPVITDVPVVFPRGGGFFLSLPLAVGDHVLLVFNERSIDKFVAGDGGDTDPIDLRMHSLSDAVAFPGFYPSQKALGDASGDALVLGKDGGLELILDPAGKLDVKIGGQSMLHAEQTGALAALTLGTGTVSLTIAEHLQLLYQLLAVWLAAHTHTSTAPGVQTSPPTQAAAVPPWDPAIVSSKVKVTDG